VCVVRSPNRYLDEFRVLVQVDLGRRKTDRFLYNLARFRFSFAG